MKRRTFLKVFGIGIGAAATGQVVGAVEFERELPSKKGRYLHTNTIIDNEGKAETHVTRSDDASEGGYIVPKEIADQLSRNVILKTKVKL